MATLVGTQRDLADLFNRLLELDFDAIEGYRKGMARLKDDADRQMLAAFMGDHERHTRELSAMVIRLGHVPSTGPDLKQIVLAGKVMLGGLVSDTALLLALRTNANDTNRAYERAVSRRDLTREMREVLERGLTDERRHRSWLQHRVEALRAA
jgi:rubrerythrin